MADSWISQLFCNLVYFSNFWGNYSCSVSSQEYSVTIFWPSTSLIFLPCRVLLLSSHFGPNSRTSLAQDENSQPIGLHCFCVLFTWIWGAHLRKGGRNINRGLWGRLIKRKTMHLYLNNHKTTKSQDILMQTCLKKDVKQCVYITNFDCTNHSGHWQNFNIATSQHCLASKVLLTNMEISWDLDSLL